MRVVAATLMFWAVLSGVVVMLAPPSFGESRKGCQYQIPLAERFNSSGPLRIAGRMRTESMVFYTERARRSSAGSEIHLRLNHSPNLDGTRSFISVSLNYGLLRSLRLDYTAGTELVVPIAPDLLRERNELAISVRHFPSSGAEASDLWTEIGRDSFIHIQCQEGTPALDINQLPYPLLDPHARRAQKLNLLLPERISTESLQATALLVANLSSKTRDSDSQLRGVRLVESLNTIDAPLLIVGTRDEQPLLSQLRGRLPAAISDVESLGPSEGVAGLLTKADYEINPILVLTGRSSTGVLQASRGLFDLRMEPSQAARIASPAATTVNVRDWLGFVPPESRFTLEDLAGEDVRIRTGTRGAAIVRLDTMPDARFLDYGLQARLALYLPANPDGSLEVFLNDNSLGRHFIRDISVGSRATLQVHAPGRLLGTSNVLKVVWRDAAEAEVDGEGLLLRSSEFYLPRHYEARLPDLALLRRNFYPFSMKADLSDTVIVVPDFVDEGILGATVDLAANLGLLLPTENLSFSVRRNKENAAAIRTGSHFIVLNVDRGEPTVQQFASPWDRRKYVLKFTAGTSAGLRQLVNRFFSEEVFSTLSGDTATVSKGRMLMRRTATPEVVVERLYITRIEAWLRSNWIALPIILAFVSILMFIPLRLALNQYRTRSNGTV